MSTRCNIVFKQKGSKKLYIYRHSDGYPECTGEDLKAFCKGYTDETLRLNISQSAGHLIVRGYLDQQDYIKNNSEYARYYTWKVGAYEPTDSIHGDIDYLYTIDLDSRLLTCKDILERKTVFKYSF